MPSQKYLDLFKNRPDVGLVGFNRLKATCDEAGIKLFHFIAPSQVPTSGDYYVTIGQGSDGWARDDYHTVRHRTLVLNCYADATRDDTGAVLKEDARAKCEALYAFLNPLLDMKTQHDWPEIISCRRAGEPQWITIPDAPSSAMLHSRYEVSVP